MAEEDYVVADRRNDAGDDIKDAPVTAGLKVSETVQATPDSDAADFAAAGNVSSAAFRNYATALNAHTDREDIESLADRRRRTQGTAFSDGDFMRAVPDGTPPTPGTPDGVAPASS